MSFRWFAIVFAAAIVSLSGSVSADEVDAVFDDSNRAFTRMKREKNPEELSYGRVKLDSKGQLVSKTNLTGVVTKSTKIVMGKLDEKTMKWIDGEAIEGGVESELFKTKGKTLRLAVFVADDKKTLERIVVKNTDEKIEKAADDFDAVLKEIGRTENFGTSIAYIRQELDEQGKVVKTFGLTISFVHKDATIALGKFNEQAKKWEAGEPIENGLKNEMFKDLGARNLNVWLVRRDDKRGFKQLLVKPASK